MKSYLWVAGTARSGTTALAQLLNYHPAIIVGQERYFNLVNEKRWHLLSPELFLPDRLFAPTPDETHNFQWKDEEKYISFVRKKYETAAFIGDKVPDYFKYFDHLFSFPGEAKALVISRNILDVCSSWKARRDDPKDVVWTEGCDSAVRHWNFANKVTLQKCRQYPDRICVIEYDRLFSHDERYLALVLRFLGLPELDAGLFDFYREQTRDWEARSSRPRRLSPGDVKLIEGAADLETWRELLDERDVERLVGSRATPEGGHDRVERLDRPASVVTNAVRLIAKGESLAGLGLWEEALDAFEAALAEAPENARALGGMATALACLGRAEEALAWYRRVLERAPDDASAHNNMGNQLVRLGRLAEAIEAFRSAVSIDPANAGARSNLGAALAKAGEPDKALASCLSAIAVAPDHAAAYANLGEILRALSLPESAAACHDRAGELRSRAEVREPRRLAPAGPSA